MSKNHIGFIFNFKNSGGDWSLVIELDLLLTLNCKQKEDSLLSVYPLCNL